MILTPLLHLGVTLPRPLKQEVLSPPPKAKALVASATNFSHSKIVSSAVPGGTLVKTEAWNKLAWQFFDTVPEFRYSCEWVGNLLSRAKIIVLQNGKPVTTGQAVELRDELFGGAEGQSEMLRQLGIHFTVAGDSYLCAADTPDGTDWFIAASSEIRFDDGTGDWAIGPERFTKAKIMVIRLWRPHPQKRWLADSPTRPSLPILSEIDGLTKHVAAQIDSRLAGAGILFVPNDMSFGAPPTDAPSDDPSEAPEALSQPDELVRTLIDAASAAMTDRQHPSALIPIVIQADGDAIKNVRHVTFWSELNAQAKDLRSEAIRRLALGMDMPPEVLTGTGDMNHWNAAQMDEAAIKAHTEPLLAVLIEALTRGYLRPLLDDQDTADEFSFGVDTSLIRVRPNRGKEAIELYDRGRLTAEVMVRENGFNAETEMMDDKQHALWLLTKLATGVATPNMVLAALREAGVPGLENIPDEPTMVRVNETENLEPNSPIDNNATSAQPQNGAPRVEAPNTTKTGQPTPSTKGHPVRRIAPEQRAAVLMASGVMVHRALERAGNRMKSSLGGKIEGVTAAQMYQRVKVDYARVSMDNLLEDAWSPVPVFAPHLGLDPVWLTSALDSYTRDLLIHRKTFDPTALDAHLALADR